MHIDPVQGKSPKVRTDLEALAEVRGLDNWSRAWIEMVARLRMWSYR